MQKITNSCALWMITFSRFYERQMQRSYFAFLIYFLYLLKKAGINRCIFLMKMLQLIFLFTVKNPKFYEEYRKHS